MESSQQHSPFCTVALPDLAMVSPVSILIMETKRLFHPFSICKNNNDNDNNIINM